MGCDIHGIIEVRKAEGEPWQFAGLVPWERNYATFACLAGVRGDPLLGTPAPRGLPADLSVQGEWFSQNDKFGDHSFTWLLWSELAQLRGQAKDVDWGPRTKHWNPLDVFCDEVRHAAGMFDVWECGPLARVVIGFDS